MNKHEAKREACWLTSILIRGWMGEGISSDSPYSEDDEGKIEVAMIELRGELERRGWKAGDKV